MRSGYLIYQDIAEPLHKDPVVETITIDKWYKDHPNPVLRKVLQTAILAGSLFFIDTVNNSKIAAQVPEWHPQQNQPQRLVSKLPRQHTGEYRFEVPRTILLTDWFQETRQPYFSKRRDVPSGEYRFEVPRTILISDWIPYYPNQLEQPLRNYFTGESRFELPRNILISDWLSNYPDRLKQPLRNYHAGESRFELPRDILLSDWFRQASEPIKIKLRQLLGGDIRTEVIGQEEITIDKWQRPASEPYFSKRRFYHTGESKFEVPRGVLLSDWYQQASERVRRKIQRLQGDHVRLDIIADDTQINEWYQPASEPYFSKRRNYFTGEFRFEAPRIILLSDWFQPVSQPYFSKRIDSNFSEYRFELPRDILLSDWFNQTSQPYFSKIRDSKFGGLLVDASFTVEVITVDKWFQLIQQPRIIRARAYFAGEFKFEIPRDILLSDWWQPASEPYFTKLRKIPSGEYRFEIPRDILLTDWFQAITQPYFKQTRQDGIFSIGQQIVPFNWYERQPEQIKRILNRIQPGEVHVNIISITPEEITIDKWFVPASEPYFTKNRNYFTGVTILQFQQIITPYYPFICPENIIIFTKENPDCINIIIESENTCNKTILE